MSKLRLMTNEKSPSHPFEAELDKRVEEDKQMRLNAMKDLPWDAKIDKGNTAWIKKIIALHGWPKLSEHSASTVEKVWVLVQHADHDPTFQESCLMLMKSLPSEEINQTNIAFLEDRVRVNTGRKQLYGTQFCVAKDRFGPQPIEDEKNLEARRKGMGLISFQEYTLVMTKLYKKVTLKSAKRYNIVMNTNTKRQDSFMLSK